MKKLPLKANGNFGSDKVTVLLESGRLDRNLPLNQKVAALLQKATVFVSSYQFLRDKVTVYCHKVTVPKAVSFLIQKVTFSLKR